MLLRKLALKNILSFKDSTVELGPLNVLIGPNAVGKSNLIEVLSLLRATATSLATEILRGGGVRQWLWLGDRAPSPIGSLECDVSLSAGRQIGDLKYLLEFSEDSNGFVILGERIAQDGVAADSEGANVYLERSHGNARLGGHLEHVRSDLAVGLMSPNESVLAQFKNPRDPTPITNLGNHFERIKIFREFRTGVESGARRGVATNALKDFLSEGGDNLAMALQELDYQGAHDRVRTSIARFCERFEDVKVRVGEGLARVFLREAGLAEPLSAMRMSDGTLKFLCLLAALFNPSPPPLICIEEPELGMHPDALRLIAEALVEASEHVQLIVTTHSEALIDALSDHPDSVLVCERDFDNGTQFKRLSAKELDEWLEHYTLGELWRKGEIGGGRF